MVSLVNDVLLEPVEVGGDENLAIKELTADCLGDNLEGDCLGEREDWVLEEEDKGMMGIKGTLVLAEEL